MIAIFPLIASSAPCVAVLGSDPTRFYPFASAPQDEIKPYCVWQIVSGEPFNRLGCAPDSDSYTVQIDSYAKTAGDARAVAIAVRDALESDNRYTITGWRGESREPDTKLFRVSFDVDAIIDRE